MGQRPNRKVCGDCRRDGGVTGGAEMCRGGAAWASGFVHRGEWPRSVSSYPMELGLSGAKKSGAFLCGSQRRVVVEGQWSLLDATDGDGVYGTARATMVAQFAMGAMVLGGCWLCFLVVGLC